jgi:flagellin-like protein
MKGISTIIASIILVAITIALVATAYWYMTHGTIINYNCKEITLERPCCLGYDNNKRCYVEFEELGDFKTWKGWCVDDPHFENVTAKKCD